MPSNARSALVRGACVACAVASLLLALVASPISARARNAGLAAGLTMLVVIALVQWVGIPWYFITRLRLDTGVGG